MKVYLSRLLRIHILRWYGCSFQPAKLFEDQAEAILFNRLPLRSNLLTLLLKKLILITISHHHTIFGRSTSLRYLLWSFVCLYCWLIHVRRTSVFIFIINYVHQWLCPVQIRVHNHILLFFLFEPWHCDIKVLLNPIFFFLAWSHVVYGVGIRCSTLFWCLKLVLYGVQAREYQTRLGLIQVVRLTLGSIARLMTISRVQVSHSFL